MKKSLKNNTEVAHVWAAQSQSEGYASHFFFEGPSIFSYGHHFEVARIVLPSVVLFNSASYSVSTSKHQGYAYSAVSHMRVFTVPSMTDHNQNAEYLIKTLQAELERIARMRKDGAFWLERYAVEAEKARDYAALFSVRKPLSEQIAAIYKKRNNPLTPETLAKLKARAKAEREAKAAREAAACARSKEHLERWKAGEDLARYTFDALPVALRVKDGVIQTSRGASVPVIEARKLWRALRTDAGSVPGMRVGHYTVDRLDPAAGSIVIGCHVIPLREVARMAVTLGLESEAA